MKKTVKKKGLAEIQPTELGMISGGQDSKVITVSSSNIDTALQLGPR